MTMSERPVRAARDGLPGAMDPSDLSHFVGLSEPEAARRLQSAGPNELPTARPRGLATIALEVVREPMILLLVVAGALYLLLGELQEALLLLASVFVVIGITLYQDAQHRARPRGPARPVEPTRTRDPRRRAAPHPRARGGARRLAGPGRGRPRAGGRRGARVDQPGRRRVAAHRRVCAGAQGDLGWCGQQDQTGR